MNHNDIKNCNLGKNKGDSSAEVCYIHTTVWNVLASVQQKKES